MSIPKAMLAAGLACAMAMPVHVFAAPLDLTPSRSKKPDEGPERQRQPKTDPEAIAPRQAASGDTPATGPRGLAPQPALEAEPEPLPPPEPQPRSRSRDEEPIPLAADPALVEEQRRNHRLVVAGSSLVAVSLVSYIVAAVGVILAYNANNQLQYYEDPDERNEREDRLQRRKVGRIMGIAAGSVAIATMLAGIPLIVVGRRRQRKILERTRTAVVPVRRGAGVTWQARF